MAEHQLAKLEVDRDTPLSGRGILSPSDMTIDQALSIINKSHSQKELTADNTYVFSIEPSNQNIDDYFTRMKQNSLENYQRDFTDGRALMNSHRTGSIWAQSELPIGRLFAARVSGQYLPPDAKFEDKGGADLVAYAYIQRGIRITDISNDDVIEGIEGGTIKDASIGFTIKPDGTYICNLCGSDLMDYESCSHVPGATYDNGRAFAWVDNAHARETSLVYKGATPDAMIDKAIRMLEGGKLGQRDALMLSDIWGVRIVQSKTLPVAKIGNANARSSKGNSTMDWNEFLTGLKTLDSAQAERITALEEAARLPAVLEVLKEKSGLIVNLQPRAALGDKWLDDLTDQAVRMRVRVEGNGFDGEAWRKVLRATNDPAYIKSELESWTRQLSGSLKPGRPSVKLLEEQANQDKKPVAPSASYRG